MTLKKKSHYSLVGDSISHETVECLRELLEQATSGKIVGIAYAAMYRRKRYIVNTAGEAYRSPTFTRGMVQALDDELGRRVRSG